MVDNTRSQWNIREGATVYGADGEKVGKIIAVDMNSIVVEKGFFFPSDYYIPVGAISSADEDNVYLTVTKDEALNQGWDAVPADSGYVSGVTTTEQYDTTTDSGFLNDTTTGERHTTAGVGEYDQGIGTAPRTTTDRMATDTTRTDREVLNVPVHEEELIATKHAREAGEVTIEKDVVTEERTINVPVTEERVRVNWRTPVEGAAPDETAFEEGSFEVPIRTEEVEVSKVAHKTGEVEVTKDKVQRTEQVSGTVRREEVHVDDPSGMSSDIADPTRRARGDEAGTAGV